MPFDPIRLQRVCQSYARETHKAVLILLAAMALTVSGVFAAVVSAPLDAATGGRLEPQVGTSLPNAAQQLTALASQEPDFSAFPDLTAELAVLTGGSALPSGQLASDFAPATPFVYGGSYEGFSTALDCLATAAWYEAGNDPAGQRSVMQVVLNRVRHPSFPKSVCAVVFQGAERTTGCQFSFTCDGSLNRRTPSHSSWTITRERALAALSGLVDPSVGQATHYHADYVAPDWSGQLEPLAKVGAHVFYRWPGKRGRLLGESVHAPEVAVDLLPDMVANPVAIGSIPVAPASAPVILPDIGALSVLPRSVTIPGSSANVNATLASERRGKVPADRGAFDAVTRCDLPSDCQGLGFDNEGVFDSTLPGKPSDPRDRLDAVDPRDTTAKLDGPAWDCAPATQRNGDACLAPAAAPLDQLVGKPEDDRIPIAE